MAYLVWLTALVPLRDRKVNEPRARLFAAPNFQFGSVRHHVHMRRAAVRAEILVQANMDLFEPIVPRFDHPDHMRPDTRIGSGEVEAERSDRQVAVARHAVHIRVAHHIVHDTRRLKITLRIAGHASAVLRPFMLQKINRRRHAEIFADNSARQGLGWRTPLRIGCPIGFRPQAMKDEAKAARITIALDFRLVALGPAMFW